MTLMGFLTGVNGTPSLIFVFNNSVLLCCQGLDKTRRCKHAATHADMSQIVGLKSGFFYFTSAVVEHHPQPRVLFLAILSGYLCVPVLPRTPSSIRLLPSVVSLPSLRLLSSFRSWTSVRRRLGFGGPGERCGSESIQHFIPVGLPSLFSAIRFIKHQSSPLTEFHTLLVFLGLQHYQCSCISLCCFI